MSAEGHDWIILACREIVGMDNWRRELAQREMYAAGRFDPEEARVAEDRLNKGIDCLRDRLAEHGVSA